MFFQPGLKIRRAVELMKRSDQRAVIAMEEVLYKFIEELPLPKPFIGLDVVQTDDWIGRLAIDQQVGHTLLPPALQSIFKFKLGARVVARTVGTREL